MFGSKIQFPANTAKKSQKCLSDNLYDFTSSIVWTPKSLYYNPIDYVWVSVEKETNHTSCNTKSQLIDRITAGWGAVLSRDTVKFACARFQSRIEAVVDADVGFYEWIVFWLI